MKTNLINSKSDRQLISILVVLNKLITLYYESYNKKVNYYQNQFYLIKDNINHHKILKWIKIESNCITVSREEIDYEDELGDNISIKGDYIVYIKDIEKIEKLYKDLRNKVGKKYIEGVNIFLKNNIDMKWKCKKCNKFIDKLEEKNKIIDYLNNFAIKKFKACRKCRHKNHFSIDKNGNIRLLEMAK